MLNLENHQPPIIFTRGQNGIVLGFGASKKKPGPSFNSTPAFE